MVYVMSSRALGGKDALRAGAGGLGRISLPRRLLRLLTRLLLLGLLLLAAVGCWAWWSLRASLPKLEGKLPVAGLLADVIVERDSLGVPTLKAEDRKDLAMATGFVHAQDRFFQMDLLRRRASGELAEVFGRRARASDLRLRRHRLRNTAERSLAAAPAERRALVEAYAMGVNAGLAALRKPPFEYLVLRAEPEPWSPVDTYLVLLAMFLQVQGENGEFDHFLGLLHDLLPQELYEFLTPMGTEWDAPLDGSRVAEAPLPSGSLPTVSADALAAMDGTPEADRDQIAAADLGSNAWAVAASRTADGRALLANDMHLPLTLPNIWYRAAFRWREDSLERRIDGITLPGIPLMVAGSNGQVAWGLTNGQIDTSDLIVWAEGEANDQGYQSPEGWRAYTRHSERLRFRGGEEETVEVVWTHWGPLVEPDHRGRRRAVRWVAHEPAAVNLAFLGMETAASVEEAVEVANRSGLPAQNFVVADTTGSIAWIVAGILPRRVGLSGRLPASWSDGTRAWRGWLAPEEVPRVIDPPSGLLWSANHRMVGGEALAKLGDGGYTLAARAWQIREGLERLEHPDEGAMLALQLDDRALFLERWRELLLQQVLTPGVVAGNPRRVQAQELVEAWQGRAIPEAVGYRIVRRFRIEVARQVFGGLTQACREADEGFVYRLGLHRYEGPLWRLVQERPAHLLSPGYDDWSSLLIAALDAAFEVLMADGGELDAQTWGKRNTLAIRHPLAGLPLIGRALRMPARAVAGDNYMPRLQHPSAGAANRLVVSPGHESSGFLQMPGGQSGHPLSPHFGDHQEAWAEGWESPLLPGPAVNELRLRAP